MHDLEETRRRFRISIRITDSERAALDADAARAGLCRSAFVRARILGAKPSRAARRPLVEAALLASIVAGLGQIADTLHPIAAARSGEGAGLTPFVERELLHALRSLRLLRITLFKAFGHKAEP